MPRDIRSFFQVMSKKAGDNSKAKKAPIIADSDDEDVVKDTPEKPTKKLKRKTHILSSDSEGEFDSKKSKTLDTQKKDKKSKLKPISLDDLNKPVKQSIVEHVEKGESSKKETANSKEKKSRKKSKSNKDKKNTELGVHGDKDFEKTLQELDEDSDDTILLDNLDILDKTIEEALEKKTESQNEKNENSDKIRKESVDKAIEKTNTTKYTGNNDESKTTEKSKSEREIKKGTKGSKKDEKHDKIEGKVGGEHNTKKDKKVEEKLKKEKQKEETPTKSVKRPRDNCEATPTTKKKIKLDHTDSGIDPDQEKLEKKRYSAGLFQAYLHRPGPKNHGQKEYPKGKPDCLSGLTFLRTGVLDSLEGDEFQSLVIDHGARVVHAVSKKVNFLVVGDEPGPAKLEKARNYKIPEITEDEFLDMILVKSGMKPRYAVKVKSEDFGYEESEHGSDDLVMDDSPKKEVNGESNQVKTEMKEVTPKCNIKDAGTSDNNEKKSIKSEPIEYDMSELKKEPSVSIQSIGSEPKQNLNWTERYKPTCTKEIIGQQDPNSNMNKLKKWLQDWFKNQDPERRKKMPKPNPYRSCGSGDWYKAALLSGPPGVGKTTTATLVCKELGFDIVEFNASDTRNKKLLQEEISQMMNSKTLAGFASGDRNVNKKRVLLMDEVDGMAGNEDRGGIAELINFIKTANFPIICMCNNRDHQKMRTLLTHCFELKFGKPNVQQVRGAMLSICFKEGLKIKPDALARLITGTGCDIRQTLNHLAMWSAAEKEISSDVVQKESKNSQKDVVMGTWDVVRALFTKSINKDMSIADKSRLFYYDYSLGPLFVQENYFYVTPECTGSGQDKLEEELIRRYLAADCISTSDTIESKIRSTNNWSLLESQAFYSTVLPSHYMSGTMQKCNFPSWFGLNSRRKKRLRIVSELYSHARTRVSGDKNSMHLDYAEPLRNKLLAPLKKKGAAGASETLEVMKSYSLLREDMLNLFDLLHRFHSPNLYDSLDSSVKLALTKLYNKSMVLNFAPPVASKKKKGGSMGDDDLGLDDDEALLSDDDDTEENITDDTLIKVKAKKAAPKASTSKGKAGTGEKKPKGKSTKSGESSKSSKGKGRK